eukprot:5433876-Amphidinium_carterae.1
MAHEVDLVAAGHQVCALAWLWGHSSHTSLAIPTHAERLVVCCDSQTNGQINTQDLQLECGRWYAWMNLKTCRCNASAIFCCRGQCGTTFCLDVYRLCAAMRSVSVAMSAEKKSAPALQPSQGVSAVQVMFGSLAIALLTRTFAHSCYRLWAAHLPVSCEEEELAAPYWQVHAHYQAACDVCTCIKY